MTANVVEMDLTVHQKVQKLLPWAVLDRLAGADRALLDEHLAGCEQCRQELAWQRKLQAVQPQAAAVPDMERALAQLLPRLESAAPPARARGWMAWALAAQLLVIAGLGAQLLTQRDSYRLLGAPAAGGASVVVVFKPEASEGRLRALLQSAGAHIVDGPTVTHAYVLEVPAARVDAAVATLRADPAVTLAEPLQAGGAR